MVLLGKQARFGFLLLFLGKIPVRKAETDEEWQLISDKLNEQDLRTTVICFTNIVIKAKDNNCILSQQAAHDRP